MYRLTSSDRPSIVAHVCNTLELAKTVKNYIESKYHCSIKIEEHPEKMYYDCPGAKIINSELYKVEFPFIDTRIDDAPILAAFIASTQHDAIKGFSRIRSFFCNICLSEEELSECKEFIITNESTINKWDEESDLIIKKQFEKLKDKNANNSRH